ncbi:MAG: FAD-dependent 5-carboxymethylaminomethyl-2-thiouridine(34) oxidoreductase MnmC [Burkholderiaceae bacterium]|nr:FAD-dependent 5-carboxymethylaminomethyl-2-thiouridine(34) oxidoreductase MnmC [Burkholderiaceae bacterium]MDO9089325.1 FAD-dependent 5-carboxymethylaminomethyl-2-thiouridine(34) oxidoreductase MnmC [Burkholderiaceae bacterium]
MSLRPPDPQPPTALWSAQPLWRVLITDFDAGFEFLRLWRAWQRDPLRPRLLHVVAIAAQEPAPGRLIAQITATQPDGHSLAGLEQQLRAQCFGLLPGFHRLVFEQGQVLLTLCLGERQAMLREQAFEADALQIDAVAWNTHELRALARCCRRGAVLRFPTETGQAVPGARQADAASVSAQPSPAALAQAGFVDHGEGFFEFNPAWTPRGRPRGPRAIPPTDAIVIGAGLAGAAVAASLARRGMRVRVVDAATEPAAGASGLPAGVFAPHVSSDDGLLSRLSRSGLRATLQQARSLLQEGQDWSACGVLQRRLDNGAALPAHWPQAGLEWSRPPDAQQLGQAALHDTESAIWHVQAGWIKPARLVQAWLSQPGVTWCGAQNVARLARHDAEWQLLDAQGRVLASAALVVVAAGHRSDSLLKNSALDQGAAAPGSLIEGLRLQPVRGQMSMGTLAQGEAPWPPFPVNGHGSLIPAIPEGADRLWLAGAGFHRDDAGADLRDEDQRANRERLRELLPRAADRFDRHGLRGWAGVRCASADRLPVVGPLGAAAHAGLWLCTAMGSRGLSFCALCAELLAARLNGEPLPLPSSLARALGIERMRRL